MMMGFMKIMQPPNFVLVTVTVIFISVPYEVFSVPSLKMFGKTSSSSSLSDPLEAGGLLSSKYLTGSGSGTGTDSSNNNNETAVSTTNGSGESAEYAKHLKKVLQEDKFRGLAELLKRQDTCQDCTCGVSHREERIVGGAIAEVNSYPWLTALMYKTKFYCGGTLISDRYVVTAAHCVHGVPKDQITLVFGEHNRNLTDESDTQYRKIGTIIRHPGFNRANFHHDIALLKLDRPFRFSKAIAPACLPVDLESEDFASERGIVAGWGRTQEKGRPSHILREVEVPIMTNEECRLSTNYQAKEITDNMLCAGYPDGQLDACQGDSGGPLNWEDLREDSSTEGTMYVIGITSWGQGCARPNYPGVYTRITKYMEWIRQNTLDSCYCHNP